MQKTRLCGYRVEGGVYAECSLSPVGEPLEYFLFDPPIKADPDALGMSAIGVKAFQRQGVNHVADWVGADSYPGPRSFLDEVRKMGLSRRIPKTFDFTLLTPESRIYVLHPKGWNKRYATLMQTEYVCPKENIEHLPELVQEADLVPEMCSGIWWDPAYDIAKDGYHPAFIAAFPITNLAVIYGNGYQEAMEAAENAGIPVFSEES